MKITFDGDTITGQYADDAKLPEGLVTLRLPDGVVLFDEVYDEDAEAEETVMRSLTDVLGGLTLAEYREFCKAKIDAVLKGLEDSVIGQYSIMEQLALSTKFDEALQFQETGELPASSILGTEASILKIPVEVLVGLVLEKGAPFRPLLGAVSAFRTMAGQVLAQEDKAAIEAGLQGLLEAAGPYLGVETT